MRFLLVDTDERYRRKLRYHIEVAWPDAEILEREQLPSDPDSADVPLDCDAILVGCPTPGQTGIAGIERWLDRSAYPPVIVIMAGGDELLAVDALKAGAASYFPRERVTHRRLIETLGTEIGAANPPASTDLAEVHGRYRLIDVLHRTNLATVYRAEALAADRSELALKVIQYVPDSGSGRLFDRFLQEYEIIAGLEHPNVVRILDFGVADDHAFIAMEYLAGGRLSDRLDRALEPSRAVDYLVQIGSALAAIHEAGILHRDLKPANILFRQDGSVALIDFGLAKRMHLEAALTGHGQIFGTPYYMSPEQGHAEPTDARSDLYSLGCIFFEMLTGRRPFTDATPLGIIYRHANAERPVLESGLTAYQRLLDRLIAIDPADRFQSATELLAAVPPAVDSLSGSVRQ